MMNMPEMMDLSEIKRNPNCKNFSVVNGAQKPPIHGCKSQLPSQKIIRI